MANKSRAKYNFFHSCHIGDLHATKENCLSIAV